MSGLREPRRTRHDTAVGQEASAPQHALSARLGPGERMGSSQVAGDRKRRRQRMNSSPDWALFGPSVLVMWPESR